MNDDKALVLIRNDFKVLQNKYDKLVITNNQQKIITDGLEIKIAENE